MGTSSGQTQFLHTIEKYGDFELELEVKLHDTDLNSGIQIRTGLTRKNAKGQARKSIHGPQVDIGKSPGRSGHIFNQGNGAWITPKDDLNRNELMVNGQWNKLRVLAVGPRIQTWINGKQVADVADDEAYAKYPSGVIALQVHGVKKSPEKARHVSFRSIRVRQIERDSVGPLDGSRDSNDSAVEGRPVVLEKPNIVLLSRVCVQTGQSSPRNGFTVFMNDGRQE